MIQWPARCGHCQEPIEDWADAGYTDGEWVHKACWSQMYREAQSLGRNLAPLRSPVDRGSQLELPMAVFMLMFHFGLATAVAGWFLLTQTTQNETVGAILVVIGIVVPLLGAAGAAANVMGRRRIESIRHELELQGGWKPGR